MSFVSIIVPVYNVEQYIDKCIKSLINQTLKNIEIILVNDGSKDNSGKICDKYAELDKRIKVIHKVNEGLSSARNAGINIAKGQYIGFVDSDDWVDENMYEKLYNNAIKNNACIVQCSVLETYTENINLQNLEDEIRIYTGLDVLEDSFSEKETKTVVVWNKIYKKELFNKLRFPIGRLHEDEFITYKLLHKAKKVVDIDSKMYFYRQRTGSIMSSKFDIKRLDAIDAYKEKKEYLKNNNLSDLSSKAEMQLSRILENYYIQVFNSNIDNKTEVLKYIKKEMTSNYINFIKNKNISTKGKLKLTIYILGGNIFYNLYKMYYKKKKLFNE